MTIFTIQVVTVTGCPWLKKDYNQRFWENTSMISSNLFEGNYLCEKRATIVQVNNSKLNLWFKLRAPLLLLAISLTACYLAVSVTSNVFFCIFLLDDNILKIQQSS